MSLFPVVPKSSILSVQHRRDPETFDHVWSLKVKGKDRRDHEVVYRISLSRSDLRPLVSIFIDGQLYSSTRPWTQAFGRLNRFLKVLDEEVPGSVASSALTPSWVFG